MSDDTCTFSYIAQRDMQPKTATGIERSWKDLKIEFGREGEGLPGARYYKTISKQGPEIFAVKPDQTVWYHDNGKWFVYKTATDIKHDTIHSGNFNPDRKNSLSELQNDDDDDDEPRFGEENGAN